MQNSEALSVRVAESEEKLNWISRIEADIERLLTA